MKSNKSYKYKSKLSDNVKSKQFLDILWGGIINILMNETKIKHLLSRATQDSGLEMEELEDALKKSGSPSDVAKELAQQILAKDIAEYIKNKNDTDTKTKLEQKTVNSIKNRIEESKKINISSKRSYCCTGGGSITTKYKKRANKKYKKTKKRKWSKKYKKSIDCKIPKGFSQRQYCLSKNKTLKRRK